MPFLDERRKWLVPALLAGLTTVFFAKVLFTNRFMFPFDAADFFYPYLSFVHEELRHFRMPFWDPYVMSGYPIIGDPEAQIFYPINWLFIMARPFSYLPYKLVEIQIVLHFFLAGLFMYYLARSFVRSAAPALLAAILFEFSGAMVAHTQHMASIDSIAWFPLIFLLAKRGLFENRMFFTCSAGALYGIQILTGHLQHSVYLGLLLFLYFAYEACCGPQRAQLWPRWIVSLAIIASLGAAVAMVQLIPTHELGNLSVRSYVNRWDITQGNEPSFLWTLFLPNYFGGLNGVPQWYYYDLSFNYVYLTVPGCLLVLLGIVETLRRKNFFWLALVLLCIELSIGNYGFLGGYVYYVPILNWFRNIPTFFDLANFALCLLAGMGAEALFSGTLSPSLKKYLPVGLTVLLILATAIGLALRLGERVHSWYLMLAFLAIFTAVADAILKDKWNRRYLQMAVFGLILLQFGRYNWNQFFTNSPQNPDQYMSHDGGTGNTGLINLLRSDRDSGFRVAAIAEYPWSGNGSNIWRIPSIYGWNPITLRRYDEYIRGFSQTSSYTLPYGGPDHNFNSSLLDLLGAKYLVIAGSDMEKTFRLRESEKFHYLYTDHGWWKVYRNRDFLSRAWFYPKAFTVPDESLAFALLSADWFDGRRTLLFENGELPASAAKLAAPISAITLSPNDVAASSIGYPMIEPYCSQPLPMYASWGGKKGDWIRFDVAGPAEPGRYLLLMSYLAAWRPTPVLDIEVRNGERSQRAGPFTLPGTVAWNCSRSRATQLGAFDLEPGLNRLTVTTEMPSGIHIFSLWLVRVPPTDSAPVNFSFTDFSVSANRFAFRSNQDRDGFILINEIYYPGWEATMDGKPVPIMQADGVFRALFAPAGEHRVEFRFRPRRFAWGAVISLLTLAAFVAYLALYGQRNGFWQGFRLFPPRPHKTQEGERIAEETGPESRRDPPIQRDHHRQHRAANRCGSIDPPQPRRECAGSQGGHLQP